MMKNIFISAMLFVLAAFVIFGSCSHPSGYGDDYPQGDGYGRIAVNINANTALTVLPTMVFDRYTYTFTKTGETNGTEMTPDNSGFFTLKVGSYTVMVSAFVGNSEPYTLAASGMSSPFTVNPGDNEAVVVYLVVIDEDSHSEPPDVPSPEPPITGDTKYEYYWIDQHDSLITTSGGAVSIALNETLAITAQGTGYIVQYWYLNGENTGQSDNIYYFSSATAGNHTVGLFVEKDNKIYNTNIIITVEASPSTPPTSNTRTVTIDMFDSYGDGWGGNGALRILVNEIEIADNVRVHYNKADNNPADQRGTNTYTFSVATGDTVQVYWVAGTTQGENSFIVYYTDTPPFPAFNADNSYNWIGENALIYKLSGTINTSLGGTLLGTFTVSY